MLKQKIVAMLCLPFAAASLSSSCEGPSRGLVLTVPEAVRQDLSSFHDLQATLRVYGIDNPPPEPEAHLEGEVPKVDARQEVPLPIDDGKIDHEISLSPGQYVLTVTYEDVRDTGNALPLLEQKLDVQVIDGETALADMSAASQYIMFDADDDGVPNLVEIRLGQNPEASPLLWSRVLLNQSASINRHDAWPYVHVVDGTGIIASAISLEGSTTQKITMLLNEGTGEPVWESTDAWARGFDAANGHILGSLADGGPNGGTHIFGGSHVASADVAWNSWPPAKWQLDPTVLMTSTSSGVWALTRAEPLNCPTFSCTSAGAEEYYFFHADASDDAENPTLVHHASGIQSGMYLESAVAAGNFVAYSHIDDTHTMVVRVHDLSGDTPGLAWLYELSDDVDVLEFAMEPDGTVYLIDQASRLMAVHAGNISWSVNLGTAGSGREAAVRFKPLVTSWGDVIVYFGDELVSVDAVGQSVHWRQPIGDPAFRRLAEGPNSTIVASAVGEGYTGLNVLEKDTGTIVYATAYNSRTTPVVHGTMMYLVDVDFNQDNRVTVYAVALQDLP